MKPSQCSRLKYKYYIIHDEVKKGESGSPIYIPTDEQTTDILTKPLSRIKFVYFREKIGIVEITPLAEREDSPSSEKVRKNIYILEKHLFL